jgi:hypothetical protein
MKNTETYFLLPLGLIVALFALFFVFRAYAASRRQEGEHACRQLPAAGGTEPTSEGAVFSPETVRGWKIRGKEETFSPENLYEYIDGGSELYLSFGFRRLTVRTYSRPGQPDIVADSFDMGSSRDAFGIFAHGRETPDGGIGQGSEYSGGLLRLWKGRFYVSILAGAETPESKEAVLQLGKEMADSLRAGELPEILSLLPEEELVRESVRYFHHPAWLNTYCRIDDRNLLGIDDRTEAVLARYGEKGKRIVLLIVQYVDRSRAEKIFRVFRKETMRGSEALGCSPMDDGMWAACRRDDRMIVAAFQAPSCQKALRLLEKVPAPGER